MSIEWGYELILKCDIKDCQSKRRFYTRMGNPKSLESAATMYGWTFDGLVITVCTIWNK